MANNATSIFDENRLHDAVEKAQDAFWEQIANAYPEITSGDFSPSDTFAIQEAMTNAARAWVIGNSNFNISGDAA